MHQYLDPNKAFPLDLIMASDLWKTPVRATRIAEHLLLGQPTEKNKCPQRKLKKVQTRFLILFEFKKTILMVKYFRRTFNKY